MKPYYQDEWWTIYCGDARDILPELESVDTIITDPVWPNNDGKLEGHDRPLELFTEAAKYFPGLCKRVVVQIGCDSDPRFLLAIPESMPFLRTCWLEYVRPGYKGRLLFNGDVAYAFGDWPPSKPGARVIPGRYMPVDIEKYLSGHPCPRKLSHVKWLVNWFAAGPVLDPFMGSGTTLRAARECGYRSIGIEIKEEYCKLTVDRIRQQGLL